MSNPQSPIKLWDSLIMGELRVKSRYLLYPCGQLGVLGKPLKRVSQTSFFDQSKVCVL